MMLSIPLELLRFIVLGTFVALRAHAFVVVRTANQYSSSLSSRPLLQQQKQPQEWEGFNPLAKTGGGKAQLLMRKVHMQELTQEIMRNINNDDASIQTILENAREFLLEPFDSERSILDPDSIFEPGMSRPEKFVRYHSVMKERIDAAQNQSLKKLLQYMMDYVVQFE